MAKKLARLKLTRLDAVETALTNLDFTADMPLKTLNLGVHEVEHANLQTLRECPTLESIALYRPGHPVAEWPPAEFFRLYDAGEFQNLSKEPPPAAPTYTTNWQITLTESSNPGLKKQDLAPSTKPTWKK